MNNPKNIQISYDLFLRLCKHFFTNDSILHDEKEINAIRNELEGKLDALIKRELFTKYKTTINPKEREKLRKEYIKKAQIPSQFTTQKETHI